MTRDVMLCVLAGITLFWAACCAVTGVIFLIGGQPVLVVVGVGVVAVGVAVMLGVIGGRSLRAGLRGSSVS